MNYKRQKLRKSKLGGIILFILTVFFLSKLCYCGQDMKEPNVAGKFYPDNQDILNQHINSFLDNATPQKIEGNIFCLISPHAGYGFSGSTAAFGYKLIQGRPYKTVIVIGPSHYYGFKGISVYPQGKFRTPLGSLEVDSDFAAKILSPESPEIMFFEKAFNQEHSVEVQLPFLQKALSGFKLVAVVVGECDLGLLDTFAQRLSRIIGTRQDVLIVASTDLYHGYDWQEAEAVDRLTLSYLKQMSPEDIYNKLKSGEIQMCGGLPVVCAVLTARALGHKDLTVLKYTNSAQVTGNKIKGAWTVGYASCAIDSIIQEGAMLNLKQKKRLLEIARGAIAEYLTNGKRISLAEGDPQLNQVSGAFVTLHKYGQLRGCIGNLAGQRPLVETIRDMAIESATADPRFPMVEKEELKDIEIEISVLSPLKKITDTSEFKLGTHGVLIRKGWQSGVFLPQVATDTGWSKEEFLSNLCSQKAGLSPEAWKDPKTEMFIFSALVFSEKEVQ